MAQNKFSYPAQFNLTKLEIDGNDVRGIFNSLSVYEDIYNPVMTGSITIADSDGAGFIEKYGIEWIEPIEFEFESAQGETFKFKGVLNDLRNEQIKGPLKFYTCGFTSEAVRKNEATFVTKSYKDSTPENIVKEMVEKMGGELDTQAKGMKMQYLASRRRPTDIIKYVLTHGVSQTRNKAQATSNKDSKTEEAKGTTGFLCWQTMDGWKFEAVDDILAGKAGENHENFETKLANKSLEMDEAMKAIVEVDFKQIGDYQTKLRSGAFASKNVSFDIDTGEYKEFKYVNTANMTDKQKKALDEITAGTNKADMFTRVFMKPISNQKFSNSCQKAQPNTGDQSRLYLQQNSGGQNTFSDQCGQMTLYPQYNFRAGDTINIKVSKVKDEQSDGGYDEKHSGKYVIQSVGHHVFHNAKGYTRIKTIRSTIQQDDSSSQKDWASGQLGRTA